ncbi:ABC transporter ATP-binding protein [Isoptericola sp. b441]|uniref:ABC transporter ATP-binding protein n=1 Tax=Actinotalea lenta TaxID=3064654 RepID=A0ABT9D8H6_9CELL|nr:MULTISPECIES: ABC transporter ATP-binding protein [unclassified Isoptericola]MDO8107194.1 ABC transporter ATP-binding protein [Isoptericola sp. b441]MDO8121128.1 ABC transporter ATP-binding protein [Isoptericola sp. b490]
MADPGEPVIRLQAVRKEYANGTVAVDSLDLDVHEHELMVLVGPSGCGKSTTLRMVNRLVEPTSGRVLVTGEDVQSIDPVALRRRIGYVIQHVGLFPHRTVAQNVGTVPALLGWDARRTRERSAELLDLVGLDHATYGKRYPHQLSGGEQQRVGVARALAADPPVLLMDEPFGAVDPAGRRHLQAEFWKIQRELGTTVMLVTHDIDEAVRLGDRIAVFSQGGHLEQLADAVTLLARPATDMVRDFVGTGRAVRLLGIGELDEGDLEPLPRGRAEGPDDVAPDLAPRDALELHGRLDDAFAALAASGGEPVPVLGSDGRPVGMLSVTGLLGALHRITGAAEADAA